MVHRISLPRWILDGSRRMNVFEAVDVASTALLVVDLQTAFLDDTSPLVVEKARKVVPNVNRLAMAHRAKNGLVVFLRHTVSDAPPYQLHSWQREIPAMALGGTILREGLEGHGLHQSLDVHDDDLIVNKFRFSAFTHNSSDLHALLQSRNISSVVVVGTMTNCCCETTARDAAMLGYKVFFIADATAAYTDAEHNATLLNIAALFGDVRNTGELLEMIEQSAARPGH